MGEEARQAGQVYAGHCALVPAVPVPSAMGDFGKGRDDVTVICGQVMCPGEVSTSRWVAGCDGV